MSDQPWYAAGLQFECTGCGRCCAGDPGYVWTTAEEIAAIAAAKGMTVADFSREMVRSVRGRYSIRERRTGDCMLLNETTRRCDVYTQRPVQCRSWPWWRENLESPEAWTERTKHCPGIGRGAVHPLDEIEDMARRDAELNGQ